MKKQFTFTAFTQEAKQVGMAYIQLKGEKSILSSWDFMTMDSPMPFVPVALLEYQGIISFELDGEQVLFHAPKPITLDYGFAEVKS